ncbi:MAG: hypothetical protein KBA51_07455 [Kiritimatiellae bacterium]|nr:hypothetical protein [Kiritimatiellia bacterium]
MADIIIPEIEFRQATVADIIHFLIDACEANAPAEKAGDGISLGLVTATESPAPDPEAFNADDWMNNYPSMTFRARNISLLEALDTICHEAGIRYWIDRNGIVRFEPKEKTQQPPSQVQP